MKKLLVIVALMLSVCLLANANNPTVNEKNTDIQLKIKVSAKHIPGAKLRIMYSDKPFSGLNFTKYALATGGDIQQDLLLGKDNEFTISTKNGQAYVQIWLLGPGVLDYAKLSGLGSSSNVYPLKAGSNLSCEMGNDFYKFSGENSELLNMQTEIYDTMVEVSESTTMLFNSIVNTLEYSSYFKLKEYYDASKLSLGLGKIREFKHRLKKEEVDYLIAFCYGLDFLRINEYWNYLDSFGDEVLFGHDKNKRFFTSLKNHIGDKKDLLIKQNLPDAVLANCPNYSTGLIDELYLLELAALEKWTWDRPDSIYNNIVNKIDKSFSGLLRDKLLAEFTLRFSEHPKMYNYLNKLSGLAQTKTYKPYLEDQFQRFGKGSKFREFKLTDQEGRVKTLKDFSDKILVIDYWYTGCTNCVAATTDFKSVYEQYKNNKKIAFLSICIDVKKEDWLKSLKGAKYTHPESVNLYTNGEGINHDLIAYYQISGYPRFSIVNHGKLITAKALDPRVDKGASIAKLIEDALENK